MASSIALSTMLIIILKLVFRTRWTNDVIKRQLAKFVETLQTRWPKALLLVLLNLRSTLFGTHKPFEIIPGCPMHLAPASFGPQLIRGDRLQYCKGLITCTKNNQALAEQSFHSMLPRDEDLKYHILQPRGFIYRKRHLQKNSLQFSQWKDPCGILITNPYADTLLGVDSCVTSIESTKPWLSLYTICWPENKDFWELKQTTAEGGSSSKVTIPDLHTFFPHYCFLAYFLPFFLGKTMLLSTFSQSTSKERNLPEC